MANEIVDKHLVEEIAVKLAGVQKEDGQTFSGTPKYRLLTPKEVVDRAVSIASVLGTVEKK